MAAMFDILIFSIGSLSQNKRLPLYKLNADGDNIDSTKNQQKNTPKNSTVTISQLSFIGKYLYFLWLRGLLLKSRKYFKQTTTCIDY